MKIIEKNKSKHNKTEVKINKIACCVSRAIRRLGRSFFTFKGPNQKNETAKTNAIITIERIAFLFFRKKTYSKETRKKETKEIPIAHMKPSETLAFTHTHIHAYTNMTATTFIDDDVQLFLVPVNHPN